MQDIKAFLDNLSFRIDEISSKLDVSITNQMKLMTFLLPHEKQITRPYNLPALPLKSVDDFLKFVKYLKDPGNMSATVNCRHIYDYTCMHLFKYFMPRLFYILKC